MPAFAKEKPAPVFDLMSLLKEVLNLQPKTVRWFK
jgi:hypothetical protein